MAIFLHLMEIQVPIYHPTLFLKKLKVDFKGLMRPYLLIVSTVYMAIFNF